MSSHPYRWARSRTDRDTWTLRRAGEDLAIAAPLAGRFYWYPAANWLPSCGLEIKARSFDTLHKARLAALSWVKDAVAKAVRP